MKSVRISILAVLLVFLASAGVSVADLTTFPICVWTGEQSAPAVSGHNVVWQDYRSNKYNIYHNNPADDSNTAGIAIQVKTTHQKFPAISGTTVVWEDFRNSSTTPDIFSCVLPSGTPTAIALASEQTYPAISGATIVWQDLRNDNGDIYCNGTQTQVCVHSGDQLNPAISGNMVVWQDNRNSGSSGVDIYRYNLDTKQEFAVCTHSGDQLNPAISGKYVVWQDNRNGSSNIDIYGKDIDTDTEFVICNASGNQINPAISGDIVVWEDYRCGSSVPHIYGYRISTQTEFAICTQTSYQKSPAIDGNFVVWQDFRNDSSGDIYGAYIPPPAEPSTITVLGPNGSEQFLAGSQCAITWQSSGSKIDFIKLEYSTDNGQTFSTIDANVANKDSYVSTLSYTWKPLPVVDSNKCIVRISDKAATPAASDISDNVFTIFQCDAALTADLNGDCKVDFRDFALFNSQWLDCGNPHDPDWCS